DLGDILASYPLSIHAQNCRRDPGYQPLGIDLTKSVLRVRATHCRQSITTDGTSL
ncbi:hypothetical protein C8R44DRAFT_596966, partial [Mycena epipterygia]